MFFVVFFAYNSPLAKITNQSFSYAVIYTIVQWLMPPIYITDHKVTICTKGPLFHTVTSALKDKKAAMQRKKQLGVFRENRNT